MSIQFFGPNPNHTQNFRSFKRYLMRPLELRSWAVREAISDLQLKKPFSAFSQLSLQFSHFFHNKDPPQNFILHIWTNFYTFRVHRAKNIGSQRPRKSDPRETILRIFREFFGFWWLLATWTIVKVVCIFMFYTSGPIFILLGHIGPKIQGLEALQNDCAHTIFHLCNGFLGF